MNVDSSIVICAHNEQEYIGDCLGAVLAQTAPPSLIIVVLDRSNDKTEEIARTILNNRTHVIISKPVARWRNSISENLEIARARASGAGFVIVDADMVVPNDFLEKLLPELGEFAAVSALARTDPSQGLLNKLVSLWERTYRIAPGGIQPRGGARAISKQDLDRIGGFRDVFAWETDVDNRLRELGRKVKLDRSVSVLHRRRMTVRRSVSYQIQAGRARRELGVSASRTLLHSVFRLRPFVIYGYFKGEKTTSGPN